MHLWNNALTVLENHPFNGAGVRSYRYAYAPRQQPPELDRLRHRHLAVELDLTEANDPHVTPEGTGMFYAHQLLLEVGAEAGVIGLAGLLAFCVVFLRAGRGLSASPLAWVAWLGALAWLFPVNTHTALYSAYWSLLIGWLIAVSSARQFAD